MDLMSDYGYFSNVNTLTHRDSSSGLLDLHLLIQSPAYVSSSSDQSSNKIATNSTGQFSSSTTDTKENASTASGNSTLQQSSLKRKRRSREPQQDTRLCTICGEAATGYFLISTLIFLTGCRF